MRTFFPSHGESQHFEHFRNPSCVGDFVLLTAKTFRQKTNCPNILYLNSPETSERETDTERNVL